MNYLDETAWLVLFIGFCRQVHCSPIYTLGSSCKAAFCSVLKKPERNFQRVILRCNTIPSQTDFDRHESMQLEQHQHARGSAFTLERIAIMDVEK
ncbi:hypothetical protein ACQCVK_13930 [Rossellomorea vietnamensis]